MPDYPNPRQQRITKAIGIAVRFGGIDGEHHKAWVIDQMVRTLAAGDYEGLVREVEAGDQEWEVGVPP